MGIFMQNNLGKRVKFQREKHGWSQSELVESGGSMSINKIS